MMTGYVITSVLSEKAQTTIWLESFELRIFCGSVEQHEKKNPQIYGCGYAHSAHCEIY